MSDVTITAKPRFDLDLWARYTRLTSGLILFTFALTHLLNHSLGLYSLDVMEQVQDWRKIVTRHPIGTTILYGALVTHVFLALAKTATRQAFRLPLWEMLQLTLGLLIPMFLLIHLADTRASEWLINFDDSYRNTIPGYWPKNLWLPILLVMVVWSHGCMGVHFWLRLRPWYRRSLYLWFALALIIPTMAIGGFLAAGQAIAAERKIKRLEKRLDSAWYQAPAPVMPSAIPNIGIGTGTSTGIIPARFQVTPPDTTSLPAPAIIHVAKGNNGWTYKRITEYAEMGRWMFGAFALLVFLTPSLVLLYRRRGDRVMVRYPNDRQVRAIRGASLLEISRRAKIPHTSVCGGRGRCSTCRIRIGPKSDPQPAPNSVEQKLLTRLDAPDNVRLACQLRPVGRLSVTPLVPANAATKEIGVVSRQALGIERKIVVMFADLRGFTGFSEDKLPYDTVFFLNEYFARQQDAITRHGGRIDKFMGDGVMALFGAEDVFDGPDTTCSDLCAASKGALNALTDMLTGLQAMNADQRLDLQAPLRLAIGLHAGSAVLGEMGVGQARRPTAIGDVVNAAARLESLAKEWDTPVVASTDVLRAAGWGCEGFDPITVEVRGKQNTVDVVRLDDPAALSS
ncbi:MAG: adenylate/guanylate cyclase domain-containing protein [Pseudomonadota bacterium]